MDIMHKETAGKSDIINKTEKLALTVSKWARFIIGEFALNKA